VDPGQEGAEASSAALKRIHRLERQERDRIARQLAAADPRAQLTDARRGTTDNRRASLHRVEHAIRIPMAILGVAWTVCGIVALTSHASGTTSRSFVIALFAIWFVVVVETVVRYIMVPDRRRYLASRQIEPALIVLPSFQVWKILGVEEATV